MSLPAARVGDTFTDGDVIASGSGDVFINNLPAARLGDQTTGHNSGSCFFPPTVITSGSGSVFINNLPAARMGDSHDVHCCMSSCHDGVVNSGSGNTFTG